MTANDDITKQHDIEDLVDIDNSDPKTPEDRADDDIEGVVADPDKLHEEAFGDEDESTIGKEINKDEIARVKGLKKNQQTPNK